MTTFANRFAGRTAIITGGASGAGLATAKRMVAEGARVALWDLDPAALSAAQTACGAVHVAAIDVSDCALVAAEAANSMAALGRVDILVNSAGITGATTPVKDFPVESWLRVMDINLNGVFYCCRAVVPLMLANKYGRIINLSSVAGKEGNPNASAYSRVQGGCSGLDEVARQGTGTRQYTGECGDAGHVRQPAARPDAGEPDRIYEVAHSDRAARRSRGSGGTDMLAGERGVQFFDCGYVRFVRWADDVLMRYLR